MSLSIKSSSFILRRDCRVSSPSADQKSTNVSTDSLAVCKAQVSLVPCPLPYPAIPWLIQPRPPTPQASGYSNARSRSLARAVSKNWFKWKVSYEEMETTERLREYMKVEIYSQTVTWGGWNIHSAAPLGTLNTDSSPKGSESHL